MNALSATLKRLLARTGDFRIRLFNILALAGTLLSLVMALLSAATGVWFNVFLNLLVAALSAGLLCYSYRTGKYRRCYLVTIAVIFFGAFPALFFTGGGYYSGMPVFFVFAVVFTMLMLEGTLARAIAACEVGLYALLCYLAYRYPHWVTPFASEAEAITDLIFALIAVSAVCGFVLHFHLKEYEWQKQLLADQNDRLRRYDEAKSTFLTTVAHEIKNPLSSISIHARDTFELLEEEPQDKPQMHENLEIIQQAVQRIDRILLDLMDTVSIEQGRLALSLAPVSLAGLLDEAARDYARQGYRNGNTLRLDVPEPLPSLQADGPRLFQVLCNLLANAERYTKKGQLTLSLRREGAEQVVCVADTGTGMSEKMQQNAFKGYVSASEDYWRHGIGLYVCHQIVTAHGGRIWLQSAPGAGTRVYFALPEKED